MTRTSLIIASLFASAVAHAQPTTETPVPAASAVREAPPRVTIMWAPLRLAAATLVELTAEVRVLDKLGVMVLVGGGKRTIEFENMTEVKGTEIEGGAQVRYYVLGDFRKGMQLGAEVLYEHVKFDEPLPPNVLAVAAGGLTVGPFVGYKIATNVGFTFEAQLGARYLAADPPVTGSGGTPMSDKKWLPLLHLNVGWSF